MVSEEMSFENVDSLTDGRATDALQIQLVYECNRKAMNRNLSNQKSNPAHKTKAGNK